MTAWVRYPGDWSTDPRLLACGALAPLVLLELGAQVAEASGYDGTAPKAMASPVVLARRLGLGLAVGPDVVEELGHVLFQLGLADIVRRHDDQVTVNPEWWRQMYLSPEAWRSYDRRTGQDDGLTAPEPVKPGKRPARPRSRRPSPPASPSPEREKTPETTPPLPPAASAAGGAEEPLSRVCPKCRAEPGDRCRRPDGTPLARPHRARRVKGYTDEELKAAVALTQVFDELGLEIPAPASEPGRLVLRRAREGVTPDELRLVLESRLRFWQGQPGAIRPSAVLGAHWPEHLAVAQAEEKRAEKRVSREGLARPVATCGDRGWWPGPDGLDELCKLPPGHEGEHFSASARWETGEPCRPAFGAEEASRVA